MYQAGARSWSRSIRSATSRRGGQTHLRATIQISHARTFEDHRSCGEREAPTISSLTGSSPSSRRDRLPGGAWLIARLPKTQSMDCSAVVSALGIYDPETADNSLEANGRKAIRLTAKFPIIVTTYQRVRTGQEPVHPREGLSLAGNFLYTLNGKEPDEIATRTMDVAFVLHADHELNASTFAARVTAATLSDMYSAIVSAIGTLKGPLHGGANEGVIKNLLEIGSVEAVEPWIKNAFANKQKIMGFGHRVYRTVDPRATHLAEMSRKLGERTGETKWYEMSKKMEEVVMREKHLTRRRLLFGFDLLRAWGPTDLFTPIFASSSISAGLPMCSSSTETTG